MSLRTLRFQLPIGCSPAEQRQRILDDAKALDLAVIVRVVGERELEVTGSDNVRTREEDDGLLERREYLVLLHAREEPAHHRLDLVAREGDGVRLGQRFVGESLGKPADLANEGTAEVIVGAVRALHETVPRPGRVVRVGLAGAQVALDLVGDRGGEALRHRRIVPR